MIKRSMFRRIRELFDWESYVHEHHQVKTTASSEMRIDCINCIDRKKKLYINPDKGVFYCHKCNFNSKNYDVFDFVSKTEGITRFQAMTKVIREYSETTPDEDELEDQLQGSRSTDRSSAVTPIKTLDRMPEGLYKLEDITPKNAKFWKYLVDRGLTKEEILSVGFNYTPLASLPVYGSNGKYRGDLADRVVVPIYGGNNSLVSWQGRSIRPGERMKYLSAPETEMAKTVWPYVPPHNNKAVLVEGIYDAIAVRRLPKVSAYATFTKKISLEQMLRLKSWGVEEVTVFWDKSDASKDMVRAVAELVLHFKKVYVSWMRGWASCDDAGSMLADPAGAGKIEKALADVVDTSNDLEFVRWQLMADEW